MPTFLRSVNLLAFASAIPLAALAAPRYEYTAVELANGKGGAYAISNSGYIAGHVTRGMTTRAFVFSHGSVTEIEPLPGNTDTSSYGVNNRGQVVGPSSGDDVTRPYIYSDGVTSGVGPPGQEGIATGINDAGHVVGVSYLGTGALAFVYRNGTMHYLGTLPGGQTSYATAINNRGQITGGAQYSPPDPIGAQDHAFMYQDGTMKDLGTLGGPRSTGYAINELGVVVGASTITPGDNPLQHAFLYSGGRMHDLGTLVSGTSSQANAINNLGQVVGWYSQGRGRAFIYQRRGGMRDLSSMVDPSSGWFIHAAYGINDRQQIVALGCKNGQYGAVLLNPAHRGGWLESSEADLPAAPTEAGRQENPPCPLG